MYGAKEFINNNKRWCLWLVDVDPSEIKNLTKVMERIEAVRKNRSSSDRVATKKLCSVSNFVWRN